jgi:hypothetical protein
MTAPRLNSAAMVSLLMLVAVPLSGGQNQKPGTLPKVESLACEVRIHDSDIRPEAENEMKVSIHNLLAMDLTIDSLEVVLSPSYYLRSFGSGPIEDAYVGLVNLETKRALDPGHPAPSLTMSAQGTETFTIDLSSLNWGQAKSSQMPSHGLKSVRPGKYTLYVSIMRDGNATEHISNRIAVQLQR